MKVSIDDIEKMVDLYQKFGSYAAVARETGFSASTVTKYIKSAAAGERSDTKNIIRFDAALIPPIARYVAPALTNWGDICVLSQEEIDELPSLWGELTL